MEFHDQFVIEFAKRTRENLEFIDAAHKDGADVNEFTQFANSLLGLLVFPREYFVKLIPNTPLQSLVENHGWPRLHTTRGMLKDETLDNLMNALRISVTHCLVEFLSGSDKHVSGLRLWNGNANSPRWEIRISVDELRQLVFKFVELIENQNAASGDV